MGKKQMGNQEKWTHGETINGVIYSKCLYKEETLKYIHAHM